MKSNTATIYHRIGKAIEELDIIEFDYLYDQLRANLVDEKDSIPKVGDFYGATSIATQMYREFMVCEIDGEYVLVVIKGCGVGRVWSKISLDINDIFGHSIPRDDFKKISK